VVVVNGEGDLGDTDAVPPEVTGEGMEEGRAQSVSVVGAARQRRLLLGSEGCKCRCPKLGRVVNVRQVGIMLNSTTQSF
jgi:hypothetical protein